MTLTQIFPPVAWWQFWNPGSGFAGGLLCVSILGVLVFLVIKGRQKHWLRALFEMPLEGQLVRSRTTGGTYEVCGITTMGWIEVRLWNEAGPGLPYRPKQPRSLESRPPWFWFNFDRIAS